MKFNFDSKILAVQIPSGIILGLLTILISKFISIPFFPTKIHILICLIFLLDLLHLFGKIDIDISNLCQRKKFVRMIKNENIKRIFQIYFEEHFIFLLCLFLSLILTQLILHLFDK